MHTLIFRSTHLHVSLVLASVYVCAFVCGCVGRVIFPMMTTMSTIGVLERVLPLLLYRCSPGGTDIPRSVPVPDQDGYGMETSRSLIFIYFFINYSTVHSLLSLLFKLY